MNAPCTPEYRPGLGSEVPLLLPLQLSLHLLKRIAGAGASADVVMQYGSVLLAGIALMVFCVLPLSAVAVLGAGSRVCLLVHSRRSEPQINVLIIVAAYEWVHGKLHRARLQEYWPTGRNHFLESPRRPDPVL
eukprot:SAG31_NODE_6170_length_2139_cov_1.609804_1_plen_133_part_00